MPERRYPHFLKETIAKLPGTPISLRSFSSHSRKRGWDDLVLAVTGHSSSESGIWMYKNPRNVDFDEGVDDDEDLRRWRPIRLTSLSQPKSLTVVDVSGNGLNDLIVTSALEANPHEDGRISWLENFGTDEGDWSRREIGSFPGANTIRVGHFTNTFSLQLLAFRKVPDSRTTHLSERSSLLVLTRPPDVYNCHAWLVTSTREITVTCIRDCLVVNGSKGQLDHLIISANEGVFIAWYEGQRWHKKALSLGLSPTMRPEHMVFIKMGHKISTFMAVAEGSMLFLCEKGMTSPKERHTQDVEWDSMLVDNLGDGQLISEIFCYDFDGDGTDEIFVSVTGNQNALYCFMFGLEGPSKFKLSETAAISITGGRTRQPHELALATAAGGCELSLFCQDYVSCPIWVETDENGIAFHMFRDFPFLFEADVIDISGFVISLCICPPNASCGVAQDVSEAVKVLHGKLGWIDDSFELIERTAVAAAPGCVAPMLVDCPEGVMRSGDEGAAFLRMRPSVRTNGCNFEVHNILPSFFPTKAREFPFVWKPDATGAIQNAPENNERRLSAIRFFLESDGLTRNESSQLLASIDFVAVPTGSRYVLAKEARSSHNTPDSGHTARFSVRACLRNPTGDAALVYCTDNLFAWSCSPPTPYQISRARRLTVPSLYEHGPIWHTKDSGDDANALQPVYPWHAWSAGKKQREEFVVWMIVDFVEVPADSGFTSEVSEEKITTCTIC